MWFIGYLFTLWLWSVGICEMEFIRGGYSPLSSLSCSRTIRKTECGVVGDRIIKHLLYADDLVVFSPWLSGLQQLLKVCIKPGIEFNAMFNVRKSKLMNVWRRGDGSLGTSDFVLSCEVLWSKYSYLDYIISIIFMI